MQEHPHVSRAQSRQRRDLGDGQLFQLEQHQHPALALAERLQRLVELRPPFSPLQLLERRLRRGRRAVSRVRRQAQPPAAKLPATSIVRDDLGGDAEQPGRKLALPSKLDQPAVHDQKHLLGDVLDVHARATEPRCPAGDGLRMSLIDRIEIQRPGLPVPPSAWIGRGERHVAPWCPQAGERFHGCQQKSAPSAIMGSARGSTSGGRHPGHLQRLLVAARSRAPGRARAGQLRGARRPAAWPRPPRSVLRVARSVEYPEPSAVATPSTPATPNATSQRVPRDSA